MTPSAWSRALHNGMLRPFRRRRRNRGGGINRRLRVEPLENRICLDGSAALWTNSPDLTLSFAPDGTDVASSPSALYAEMAPLASTSAWQETIVQAFNTWLTQIGGTLRVVADSGDPFGTPGATQGDPRFGDIRVGAVDMPGGPVAMAVPHNAIISGTWSGDVLFNTAADFQNLDDVFSVALHEAGHVLGLEHSTEPTSPMSVHGVSDHLVPTALDIAHLKALYGVLVENEGGGSGSSESEHESESDDATRNDQLFWAQSLAVPQLPDQLVRYEVAGSIATTDDVDYFALQPSSVEVEGLKTLLISVRSTLPNGLIPSLQVFDARGKELKLDVLRNDNGTLVAQVDGAEPEHRTYLRLAAGSANPGFQLGPYEIVASFETTETRLTQYAEVNLPADTTETALPLHVDRPQLVHFALQTKPIEHDVPVVVWATIHDEKGELRYQAATVAGETRSAPTVFLEPGDYRITFSAAQVDDQVLDDTVELKLVGANVSLPFGPGLVDPTTDPVLPCNQTGADPNYCLPIDHVATDPVIWPGQPKPGTEPTQPVSPPNQTPDWWYWQAVKISQQSRPADAPKHNGLRPADVNDDHLVTPRDALIVLEYLNQTNRGATVDSTGWFLDVNNDQLVTPLDVLLVISTLA